MKWWSLLLPLLALLWWFGEQRQELAQMPQATPSAAAKDYMRAIVLTQNHPDGRFQFQLSGAHLSPQESLLHITQARFQSADGIRGSARHGWLETEEPQALQLEGAVQLFQPGEPPLRLHSERLDIDPQTLRITSPKTVSLEFGGWTMRGQELHAEPSKRRFDLRHVQASHSSTGP